MKDLKKHCQQEAHHSFRCAVEGCVQMFGAKGFSNIRHHFTKEHPEIKYTCAECGAGFNTNAELDCHGLKEMHAAYKCSYPNCEAEWQTSAKFCKDQLEHQVNVPSYPCPYCNKYVPSLCR